MARQTFTKGQTVYVAHYSRHNFKRAVVADPDVVKQSYGYGGGKQRDIHYVGVNYVVDDKGKVDVDRQWDILNNRQQIVDEAEYAKIAQAKDIGKLHRVIEAHHSFEREFAEYIEQATTIVDTFKSANDVLPLALFLRGAFSTRYQHSRLTPEEVTKVRGYKRADTEAAHLALQGMGETPPKLP